MKKIILPLAVAATTLLSACSSLQFHKPITFVSPSASVSQKTLADGTKVKVGTVKPTVSWRCREVDTVTYDWKKITSETNSSVTPYAVLTQKALTYAKENHLKFNYIHIDLPANNSAVATANTIYYQCQKIRIN